MAFFRAPEDAGNIPNQGLEELRKTVKQGTDVYEYAVIDGIISRLTTLDGLCPAEDSSAETQKNHGIITDALRVINDAGAKMKEARTFGLAKAVKVLEDFKANKEKYVGDMEQLGRSFGLIRITSETAAGWRDLSDWFQELHDITANAKKDFKKDDEGFVLALKDGTYPPTCIADQLFKTSTGGTSKYTLIYNYGVAAKHIRNAVITYEAEAAPAMMQKNY